MRKCQIKSKLDHKLYHVAKDQVIEIDLLKRLGNNKEIDIILGNDDDVDMLDT